MNKREIFEKYDNLSKNKLNIKNNKEVYVKNDVMTSVIIRSKGKKKKRTKNKNKKKFNLEEKYGLQNLILWYANNDRIRGMLMQNSVAVQKSRCSICDSTKSTFLKQKLTSKMLKAKIYR